MFAKITYVLSTNGQKASILAGGDGKEEQTLIVERDSPEFPRVVARGSVGRDGSVALAVHGYVWYADAPMTAADVLDKLDSIDAEKAAEKAAKDEERRQATITVLRERKTTKHEDTVSVNAAGETVSYGGKASAPYKYEKAAWTYYSDNAVMDSPEAQAWVAELAAAKAAALEAALAEARAKLPAILAAEKAAADAKAAAHAKRTAIKESLGGCEGDYLIGIESGALTDAPVWESHARGKNWMAEITPSPSSPGGLSREFAEKAKGDNYYILPDLAIGDALEFGADYYSGSGRKSAERWYGFVVAITAEYLLLRPCSTGKGAHKAGQAFAAEQAKAAQPSS